MHDAMRNRSVLFLVCVLAALGSLLCIGKESLAKQPAKAPERGGSAVSSRQAIHRPSGAPNTGPRAERSRPTRKEPVGRRASEPRQFKKPRGRRFVPYERPAHEPPGLREHGPQPEQSNRDHLSRPLRERPASQTGPHYPHHSKGTGPKEGAGSPDQHGNPASPPGRENIHPKGKSAAEPGGQTRQPLEHGKAAGHKPDEKIGNSPNKPTIPRGEKPVHTGTSAYAPDGGPSSIGNVGAKEPPGRQLLVRPLAGQEVRSGFEPSQHQAGFSDPRSLDLRREDPESVADPSSVRRPDLQDVRSSLTLDPVRGPYAVSDAPPGETQRPAGEQVQLAPGSHLGSTKLLLDPQWYERSSLVDLTQAVLRSVPGGTYDLSTGTLNEGSFAQSDLPLEVPSPFFGFVPMMGGAATGFGSSGGGTAPLLAVVVLCLIALLYQGRSHILSAFLRLASVSRPALERPG